MSDIESALDVGSLLDELVTSFTEAAGRLQRTMDAKDWNEAFVYRMPRMSLEIKVSLSYSDKKLKGIFRKSARETESGMLSTIGIDVVAVPRTEGGG